MEERKEPDTETHQAILDALESFINLDGELRKKLRERNLDANGIVDSALVTLIGLLIAAKVKNSPDRETAKRESLEKFVKLIAEYIDIDVKACDKAAQKRTRNVLGHAYL